MSFVVLLAAVVATLFDVCCALGPVKQVRPPSPRRIPLEGRAGLENVKGGVVNWGDGNPPENATIVPVVLSEDKT